MIIAIDTGGTKTLIVAMSHSGEMLHKHQFPTPKSDEQKYLRELIDTITRMSVDQQIDGICIALPGVVKNQYVKEYNNLDWYEFDLVKELQPHFAGVPIWLENDANLGAVGAANMLEEPHSRCVYITISTGVGGGFVIDKKLVHPLALWEPADITFEYDGELIRWEDLASGPAIAARHNNIDLSKPTDDSILEDIGKRVARGFMVFMPIFMPNVIVIGGGVGAYYDLFAKYVEKELASLPKQYKCKITTATHAHEVVIYGCYFYAKDKLGI